MQNAIKMSKLNVQFLKQHITNYATYELLCGAPHNGSRSIWHFKIL